VAFEFEGAAVFHDGADGVVGSDCSIDLNRLTEQYTRQCLLKLLLKIAALFANAPGNEAIGAYQ
jgi:hypothetical protein